MPMHYDRTQHETHHGKIYATIQPKAAVPHYLPLAFRSGSNVNFLSKIITGDQAWIYGYDPKVKQ
jgi:hypothetical protein